MTHISFSTAITRLRVKQSGHHPPSDAVPKWFGCIIMMIQTQQKHGNHVAFKDYQTPYCHKSMQPNIVRQCHCHVMPSQVEDKLHWPSFNAMVTTHAPLAVRNGVKIRQPFGANCHVACRGCPFLSLAWYGAFLLVSPVRGLRTHWLYQ